MLVRQFSLICQNCNKQISGQSLRNMFYDLDLSLPAQWFRLGGAVALPVCIGGQVWRKSGVLVKRARDQAGDAAVLPSPATGRPEEAAFYQHAAHTHIYLRVRTRTRTITYVHAHTHAHISLRTHARVHTHSYTYTHVCKRTRAHARAHARAHRGTYMYTLHMHLHKRTRAHTRAGELIYASTYACTYTYTFCLFV